MKVERGRLIRRRRGEITVEYVPHGLWFNGVPSYFELLDLGESLEANEVVELRRPDGQVCTCMVLDCTNGCAVIATL